MRKCDNTSRTSGVQCTTVSKRTLLDSNDKQYLHRTPKHDTHPPTHGEHSAAKARVACRPHVVAAPGPTGGLLHHAHEELLVGSAVAPAFTAERGDDVCDLKRDHIAIHGLYSVCNGIDMFAIRWTRMQ